MIQPTLKRKAESRRSAFTLMELMIVVAIIVVLAGMGGVLFFNQYEKAKESAARAQCKHLEDLCTVYLANEDKQPDSIQDLANCTPPIVKKDDIIDPWGREYQLGEGEGNSKYVFSEHRAQDGSEISSKKIVRNH